MMSALYHEEGSSFRVEILREPEVTDFIDTHAAILDSAFEQTEMSDILRSRLQESDWMFSGLKTFHELKEAFPSLLDDNGARKPFEQFLKDVQSIDDTYNRNYLRAEYNFAMNSAEMAARWEEFEKDEDEYYLQYRTAGDDNVRPEHAALRGVTLPRSDKFWKTYYPPNGWNCRCTVVQVLKDGTKATDHNEAMARGAEALSKDKKGMFAFNSGTEQRTFPAYNPYTISKCATCSKAKLNLAKDQNELCKACDHVKSMVDITAALGSLATKEGKEYTNVLREIVSMKVFKSLKDIKGVVSAISESDPDFANLKEGARKAVAHGYKVYLLPNPNKIKSGDYILEKGNFIGLYDLKSITGSNSIGNRLLGSKGQANRVILNLKTRYSSIGLAKTIRNYFETITEAQEVIVFKGKKMITVTRGRIGKSFERDFCKEYTKNK